MKKLILSDTGHVIGNYKLWQERIDLVNSGGLQKIVDMAIERWFAEEFRTKFPELMDDCKRLQLKTPVKGYVGACQAIQSANLTDEVFKIENDTLVINGNKDISTPPELGMQLKDLIPNGTFKELDGIGHVPPLQDPYLTIKILKDPVIDEDIVRLTEIKIKRISKFDLDKANENLKRIEEHIADLIHKLDNIVDYAITYFKGLKKKYKEGRNRKTEIRTFETIVASKVAIKNQKLFFNKQEGFIGTSLRKDVFVCDCSDIDDIIVFRNDGKMIVTKVSAKTFVGKGIIHLAVFKKNDVRPIYNVMYRDGKLGNTYMKRFPVKSITRDKEYDLTSGNKGSKIIHFSANLNGEAEVVTVTLKSKAKIRRLKFDINYAELSK